MAGQCLGCTRLAELKLYPQHLIVGLMHCSLTDSGRFLFFRKVHCCPNYRPASQGEVAIRGQFLDRCGIRINVDNPATLR
jgi:hypothetical protein